LALPLTPLLATSVLDPFVHGLQLLLNGIYHFVPNYGWSLIILAAMVKAVFWPLNTMQFKSIQKTQALQPRIAALRERFKNDKERLNQETMALYKELGVNPLAGCFPMLLQTPILFSVYWLGIGDKQLFSDQHWLWIGSAVSSLVPHNILAANLAQPDYLLLALYMVSMYVSVRTTSPAADPAQAQQQKIMAFISPVMIGYFGFKYAWPSALILYWLFFNLFSIAQQVYLIRRHPPGSAATAIASGGAVAPRNVTGSATPALAGGAAAGGAAASGGNAAASASKGGSRAARRRRSSRR
jgi:YidC/Oxa1 family membrane protein insertase